MANDHTTGSCTVTAILHPTVRSVAPIPTEAVCTNDVGALPIVPTNRCLNRTTAAIKPGTMLLTIQVSARKLSCNHWRDDAA